MNHRITPAAHCERFVCISAEMRKSDLEVTRKSWSFQWRRDNIPDFPRSVCSTLSSPYPTLWTGLKSIYLCFQIFSKVLYIYLWCDLRQNKNSTYRMHVREQSKVYVNIFDNISYFHFDGQFDWFSHRNWNLKMTNKFIIKNMIRWHISHCLFMKKIPHLYIL